MGVRPPPPPPLLRLCDASASASASLRRILCSSLVRMPSNVSPLKLQSSRSSSSKLSPATACAEIALPPLCTAQARAPIGGLLQLLQRDDSGQHGRLIAIVEMGPPLDAACSLRLVRRPAHWSLFSRRIRRGECLHLFLCTGRLGSLPPTTFAQYRYWLQGTVPIKSTQGYEGRPRVVEKYGCLVMEVEDWIDAINHPEWQREKKQIFGPGDEPYVLEAKYVFSVNK